jgi:hypothetical protein
LSERPGGWCRLGEHRIGQHIQAVDLQQQRLVPDPRQLRHIGWLVDGREVGRHARQVGGGRLGQAEAAAVTLPLPEVAAFARVRVAVAEAVRGVMGLGGTVVAVLHGVARVDELRESCNRFER